MKFYILTSRDLPSLERHKETIPTEDQVVIINSLDDGYIRSASEYCEENNITYHITESDGTAGTGKNSVMKKFLETDEEYMVQVDGDDEITKFGYEYYKSIADLDTPPDLIVLHYQWQRFAKRFSQNKITGEVKVAEWARMCGWIRKATARKELYSPVHDSNYLRFLQTQKMTGPEPKPREYQYGNEDPETLKRWAKARCKWEHFIWNHGVGQPNGEIKDTFSRMVFYSRKSAELVHFTNELKIGEDTMAFLEMRLHHANGLINIGRHTELHEPTYIYMYDSMGVSREEQGHSDEDMHSSSSHEWVVTLWDWVTKHNLIEKYKSAENLQFKNYE